MDTVFVKDKKLAVVTAVDNEFITGYLPAAPELALKAYLYGLMQLELPSGSRGDICAALGCTDNDLRAAFSYWEGLGLVTVLAEEPLQIRYNSVGSAVYSGGALKGDTRYGEFVRRLQAVLGTRILSGAELAKLYDWLDVFGFEPEAAVAIVAYCLEKKGARTAVAYMDAAARGMAARGARTLEDVKSAIEDERMLKSGAARIIKRWNQHRSPTQDELALYEKWTEGWGFDDDAVQLACAEMTAAEKPSFAYLNSILETWHKGGAVTKEQLREKARLDDSIAEITREAFARADLKGRPSNQHRQKVREWVVDMHLSPELIYLAAELTAEGTQQFANMKRIIKDWHDNGISGLEAAKAYYEAYQKKTYSAQRSTSKTRRALNYMQGGTYTKEELKKLGVSLGEEFYEDDD